MGSGEPPEQAPSFPASVQLGRSAAGVFYWRIHVNADGTTLEALRAAKRIAEDISDDLEGRYPPLDQ